MAKKIIIIGGGIAGLSTGIYGQMNGYDTEIIEMNKIPGGQCTAWDRKGYRFDYCLHWLVGSAKGGFNEIWKELNVINDHTEVINHEVFTALTDDKGEEFIIYTNIDRWEKYLLEIAPEDKKGIRKMCGDMRKTASFDLPGSMNGIKNLGKRIAFLFRILPVLPLFVKYGRKDCNAYFKELHFKNPRLIYFLNKILFGNSDFSAIALIMTLGWFHKKNAGYLIGGSMLITNRMVERYRSLGGKLVLGKKVAKINVENDATTGVILSDGTSVKADYVVSAADGHATIYDMLEGKYVSKQIENAYNSWELFTPIIQVSFGINSEIKSKYPAQSFIAEGRKIGTTELKHGYTLMNYSFDPTMAQARKTTIVMRFESPWNNWKDMKDEEYKAEKERIKADATALLESHYSGISNKIEVVDVATPLTDVRYTGVWKASYEGFMPTSKNITKGLKNTLPNLNNFYMAGQWLTPGGGLPPSAEWGKKVIKQICKKEKKGFVINAN
jgi:phytoene dehydrogenase-like protein